GCSRVEDHAVGGVGCLRSVAAELADLAEIPFAGPPSSALPHQQAKLVFGRWRRRMVQIEGLRNGGRAPRLRQTRHLEHTETPGRADLQAISDPQSFGWLGRVSVEFDMPCVASRGCKAAGL